jgi:hypothetical protein
MEQIILRLTITSLAALITASCSRRLDSQPATEQKKPEKSEQVEGHDGNVHSASESTAADANAREAEGSESQPSTDDIIEDCHGFVWLTKVASGDANNANCPQCPSKKEAAQALVFRGAEVKRVSCTGERCEVIVVIHANFNPSKGGTISGGLTGWIPLQQREQYSHGETPSGEQIYEVMITYRREGSAWRTIEFARP